MDERTELHEKSESFRDFNRRMDREEGIPGVPADRWREDFRVESANAQERMFLDVLEHFSGRRFASFAEAWIVCVEEKTDAMLGEAV